MSEWRPIETAPKDGTPVWLVEDGAPLGLTLPHQCAGYWRENRFYMERGFWQVLDRDWVAKPTHWMPLPEAPK